MRYPDAIEQLIQALRKLPGVGRKTAERYAFDLFLNWTESERGVLQMALADLRHKVSQCPECGCLSDAGVCRFCTDGARGVARNDALLCIVASPKDVFAMENTEEYRGRYHVLGALLSPLDGRGEELLQIDRLIRRIQKMGVREVILALDASLEGDATSLFLKEQLAHLPLSLSRLAFGIPLGSSLEFVDGGTLRRALHGRSPI